MLKLRSSSIIVPPLVLVIVGLVIYVLVERFTTPQTQVLEVQPAAPQSTTSASPLPSTQLNSGSQPSPLVSSQSATPSAKP